MWGGGAGWGCLTQSEAPVQLQVGSEESGQAGQQFAAGLSSVQFVAAVDQTVGGGTVVSLVQNSNQQLTLTDHHLDHRKETVSADLTVPNSSKHGTS